MFAWLMGGQWFFAIGVALLYSPYTWTGKERIVHLHVHAAILLGGLISGLPIALTLWRPGAAITRHTIAVAQMLWSALLIHLTGGRIETHFHIFGSLAFLAFYRDWKVLVPATVVVATDHFVRSLLWPESVFGILNPEWWRFLEHAFWVVFEDFFLVLAIRRGVDDFRSLARRQADLEHTKAGVEQLVELRTEELSSSREQYRSLVETIHAIPFELDVSADEFRYVGPQATEVTGFSPEEWSGVSFLEERVLKEDESLLRSVLSGERGSEATELRFEGADGDTRWLSFSGRLVRAPDGAELLRGLAVDVTAQRRLEQELQQSQKLESLGQLAAGIAHEINTPIQYIGDNARFLQEAHEELSRVIEAYEQFTKNQPAVGSAVEELNEAIEAADADFFKEEVPGALSHTIEGVEQVARIVQAMKEFSHPGSKSKTPTDINRAVENTLAVARNEWKYVAELSTELDPDLPDVICSPGEVNQVLLNLVINAAHAMGDLLETKGKGQLTLRTSSADGHVQIEIGDTGSGISDDVAKKIFDPFFTTKAVGKGTGQGLSIAHSVVVERHGGTLAFETKPGEGTTFFVRLPIEPVESDKAEAA